MRFPNLQDWLSWQETLHPQAIDLGLERVQAVAAKLGLTDPPYRVFTVGGTNGKGSCVAWLTAFLDASGRRVGTFTSPHLLRYTERIVVAGDEVDEAALCRAFDAVDRARGATSLTYFEFSTLAALLHFRDEACDTVVLEVGMGGRLDATNVVTADAALVVSVGIDHIEWLGKDREAIGFEKAGIFRAGRPAVCADPAPPASLLAHIAAVGAEPVLVGVHYGYRTRADGRWDFTGRQHRADLPVPCLPGAVQYANAAAALATLDAAGVPLAPDAVVAGLSSARLRARFERIAEDPELIVDVAHNPDGARVLAENLAALPAARRCIAVCGMFSDKAIEATLRELDSAVDHWVFTPLPGPRAADAAELMRRADAAELRGTRESSADVGAALARARELATPTDRIIAFGSFLTAAAVLAARR